MGPAVPDTQTVSVLQAAAPPRLPCPAVSISPQQSPPRAWLSRVAACWAQAQWALTWCRAEALARLARRRNRRQAAWIRTFSAIVPSCWCPAVRSRPALVCGHSYSRFYGARVLSPLPFVLTHFQEGSGAEKAGDKREQSDREQGCVNLS